MLPRNLPVDSPRTPGKGAQSSLRFSAAEAATSTTKATPLETSRPPSRASTGKQLVSEASAGILSSRSSVASTVRHLEGVLHLDEHALADVSSSLFASADDSSSPFGSSPSTPALGAEHGNDDAGCVHPDYTEGATDYGADYNADVAAAAMSRLLSPQSFLLRDADFVDITQLHVSPGSDYASDVARSERGGSLRPRDVQTVLISGTSVVRHLQERPFTLYQLHVPLLSKEHVAFRRYSDFVELDARLRQPEALGPLSLFSFCASAGRELPPLPAKTAFWEDSTSTAVISRRWGALQLYLDAALEAVHPYGDSEAWGSLKDFLNLA